MLQDNNALNHNYRSENNLEITTSMMITIQSPQHETLKRL